MTSSPATAPPIPKQSAWRGTTGKLGTTGIDDSAFARDTDPPLLRFFDPSAHCSRGACLLLEGGQPSRARLDTIFNQRCCSRWRTHWGGSFRNVSSCDIDARSRRLFDLRARVRSENPILFISRSPKILPYRATPLEIRAVRARHAPSRFFFDAVFRYALFRTSTAWPSDEFLLPFLSRLAALLGSRCPSQVCSRG